MTLSPAAFRPAGAPVRRLGRALSVLAAVDRLESEIGADLEAFGAPGECYPVALGGMPARRRLARRLAESVAGMSVPRLWREAERICGKAPLERAWRRASEPRFGFD